MSSKAYPGYGSKLKISLDDGLTFVPIAQLKTFGPSGSKQQMLDQTSTATPGNFTQPLAVRVASGEFPIDGVLIPTDPSQVSLAAAHTGMLLATFLATLTNGTGYMFQAYVSEFVPFSVKVKNAITFSAKLTIVGGIFVLSGVFDVAAFDLNAFAVS